jgi:hypothetical protein
LWLSKHGPAESILLMTDDTRGTHRRDRASTGSGGGSPNLRPAAIGVGTEDFRRWFAQMDPQALSVWLRRADAAHLPFVASNVIIRKSGHALNVVRDPRTRIALRLPANESLGPVRSLEFSHPCSLARELDASAFRFDETDAPAIRPRDPAGQR